MPAWDATWVTSKQKAPADTPQIMYAWGGDPLTTLACNLTLPKLHLATWKVLEFYGRKSVWTLKIPTGMWLHSLLNYVNHWVLEFRLAETYLPCPPWRAPVMDTSLLLDPIMVPATNKHYTFNLPYEDMGCLLREVWITYFIDFHFSEHSPWMSVLRGVLFLSKKKCFQEKHLKTGTR